MPQNKKQSQEGSKHKQWREAIEHEMRRRLEILQARQTHVTLNALKGRYNVTHSYLSRIISQRAIHVFSRHAIELEQAAAYMGLTLSDFFVIAARFFMEKQRLQLAGPATSNAATQFNDTQLGELWELISGTQSPQYEPDFAE